MLLFLNSLLFVKNKIMINKLRIVFIEVEINYIMKKIKLCIILGY